MSLTKRIENFWFYHKWKVIAGVILLIGLVMAVRQCRSLEPADYTVVLFTYSEYTDGQLDHMAYYMVS